MQHKQRVSVIGLALIAGAAYGADGAASPGTAHGGLYELETISDCDYGDANRSPALGWLGVQDAYGRMGAESTGQREELLFTVPHGSYDTNTKALVTAIVRRFGGDAVWATGYRSYLHFINVNRPTEGYGFELETPRARRIFEAFSACMQAHFSPQWVVEVHGNSRAANAEEIQVATVNVDADTALQIQQAWETVRVGRLDHFDLLIEPIDDIYWGAGSNKDNGLLSRCEQACLHFEFPRALREEDMIPHVSEVLSDLLELMLDTDADP